MIPHKLIKSSIVDSVKKYNKVNTLLEWYVSAGVDETTNTSPRNRLISPIIHKKSSDSDESNSPISRDSNKAISSKNIDKNTIETNVHSHQFTKKVSTLRELNELIQNFDGCALKRTATTTVFGAGTENARLMIIGEAPGAEEDREGQPFVGPAGQLLTKMLSAIKINRNDAYITNVLPWRPPGNRSPTDEEIALCRPFIEQQILLVRPKILILLGAISAKTILNRPEGITRLRGIWHKTVFPQQSLSIATIATFHPAYLLRQPSAKKEAWEDLQAVQLKLENLNLK